MPSPAVQCRGLRGRVLFCGAPRSPSSPASLDNISARSSRPFSLTPGELCHTFLAITCHAFTSTESLDVPLPRQTVPFVRTTASSRSPKPNASAPEVKETSCIREGQLSGPHLPLPMRGDAVLGQGWRWLPALPLLGRQDRRWSGTQTNLLPRRPTSLPWSLMKASVPGFS